MENFRGKVRKGQKRGKRLGFPTANISLHKKIPEGIYVSRVTCDGKTYNALTFIGSAKTFGEKMYQSETYILDFDKDIYGKWLRVFLLKKIRGNEKFISETALVKQMEEDKKHARKYFTNNPL